MDLEIWKIFFYFVATSFYRSFCCISAAFRVCSLNSFVSLLKSRTMSNNKNASEIQAVDTTERITKLRTLFKKEKYNLTA